VRATQEPHLPFFARRQNTKKLIRNQNFKMEYSIYVRA
jgi:hypothetical protein